MKPTAWRARHDAFANAARALRLASPQGPAPEAVASLTQAHALHARYEEDVLWPHYAAVAPEAGPGSLQALRRDHHILAGHLAHAADPDPLVRAWTLARLEAALDHHDQREATYVLPALERLGVDIDLDEPDITHPLLEPVDTPDAPPDPSWPDALRSLALDRPCDLPAVPEAHPKVQRLRARYEQALSRTDAPLAERRSALLEAFDRALELAWCAGQGQAPWVRRLRALSPPPPTTPR